MEKRKVSGMDWQGAFGDHHLSQLARIRRVSCSQQAVALKLVRHMDQVKYPVVGEECKYAGLHVRS